MLAAFFFALSRFLRLSPLLLQNATRHAFCSLARARRFCRFSRDQKPHFIRKKRRSSRSTAHFCLPPLFAKRPLCCRQPPLFTRRSSPFFICAPTDLGKPIAGATAFCRLEASPARYSNRVCRKTLPVAALALFSCLDADGFGSERRFLFALGQSFSAIGDFLLSFNRHGLVRGSMAFAIGHVIYMASCGCRRRL